MATVDQIKVGEAWAYRKSDHDAPAEVEVLDVAVAKPARVKVRFASSRDEVWVPPSRLKVLWVNRESLLGREGTWRALSSAPDEVEEGAVEVIFREFLASTAQISRMKRCRGVMTIFDFDLVDVFIGGGLESIVEGAPYFEDSSGAHFAWPTAVAIAKRVCKVKAPRVMAYVHSEEERARRDLASAAIRQTEVDGQSQFAFRAESAYQDEYLRPMCELLRAWCGEAARVHDEVAAARLEMARISDIVADAIALLSVAGHKPAAWELYRSAFPSATEEDWCRHVAERRGNVTRRFRVGGGD